MSTVLTTKPPTSERPLIRVVANLLPDEVVDARRVRHVRRRVVLAVIVLVLLLAGWDVYARMQTSKAQTNLTAIQNQTASLQARERTFAQVSTVQAQTAAITGQLHMLMTGDLAWSALLRTLNAQAPAGLTVTNVSGAMFASGAGTRSTTQSGTATGGTGVLDGSGQTPAGTLTVTGTASDERVIASYLDTLGRVKGLAVPFLTNLGVQDRHLSFTANLVITTAALGGRWSGPSASPTTAPGSH
jgi:Tfp pilus assembly protein PilN